MKAKSLIALLALVFFVGCQPQSYAKPMAYSPIDTFTPMIVYWDSTKSGITPTKITIDKLGLGDLVDTWQTDLTTDNGYVYKKGEPLSFTIFNGNDVSQSYSILLDNTYYGQPYGYEKWISVASYNPEVPAKSAMSIPIKIQMPSSTNETINHQWEFRIGVRTETQGNMVMAGWIRFVVTMR